MSAIPRYPAGFDQILAGVCPIGASETIACWYCRYGHSTACHHPLSCEDADCDQARRPATLESRAVYTPTHEEAATMLCRVCGCSTYDPCPGGCYWVEPELCSRCLGESQVVLR
jgi:hypothetical protein